MAETITIARPYARAAFELAQSEKGALNQWSEMLQVASLVTEDEAMRHLLANPKLSTTQKSDVVIDLCHDLYGAEKFAETFHNFIRLLADNHRLTMLPEIAAIFEKLRAEAQRTVQAQLITAFPVDDSQRDKVAKRLKERLKREVILECTVDESLIGGAIIRAGDLVIDGSAQGQLTRLAAVLRQ
jgi:F-type H+-transporting ATPase subunit delta